MEYLYLFIVTNGHPYVPTLFHWDLNLEYCSTRIEFEKVNLPHPFRKVF